MQESDVLSDQALTTLKAVSGLSAKTGYSVLEVSNILARHMDAGMSFQGATSLVLEKRKKELQGLLKDEIGDVKSNYMVTPEWGKFIDALSAEVKQGDIDSFLSWPVITKTMFVTSAPYLRDEELYLQKNGFAFSGSPVGSPPTNGNDIHQTYHIARFLNETGQKLEDFDTIFEFGGGYGCLCRIIRELGFRREYIIYDLPHFSALQRYYLNSCQVSAACISGLDGVHKFIKGKALFIATWSLSEAPLSIRDEIEGMLPAFDSFLIAYQDNFGGIDNVKYFNKIKEKKRKWVEIEHSTGNRYLFGSKE